MERIADYGVYTDAMRRAMQDKTWFLELIDAKTIVDYGCADGALIQYISQAMPGVFDLVGIDIDETMLRLAQQAVPSGRFCTPEQFLTQPAAYDDCCLNCGSVIHEVYSFGNDQSIADFWDFTFQAGFRYVAIRDMAMTVRDYGQSHEEIAALSEKLSSHPLTTNTFHQYLAHIGRTPGYKDLIHYLLKYKYLVNWEREMREDYFPLSVEEVLLKIPTDRYKVSYFQHYTLPFTKGQIKRELGIDLNVPTHYKLLLERV